MTKIKSQIVNTFIYKDIERQKDKFCLSCLKHNLIGFGLSTRKTEEVIGIFQSELRYHMKMGAFINNVFQLDKKLSDERVAQKSAYFSQKYSIEKIQQ